MSRRTERIDKLMQHVISRIIMTELGDPRIDAARTSVTRIEVQKDFLRAKVYISIYGTDVEQARGLAALQHAAGRIQLLMRDDVRLHHTPVLDFQNDERFKGTLRTFEIIQKAMAEIREKEARLAAEEGQDAPADSADTPGDKANETE